MANFTYKDCGKIDYLKALHKQTTLFNNLVEAKVKGEKGKNFLLFCEHNHVLTIGKNGKDSNLLITETQLKQRGIELYHIERGGDITYHGPGQITGYPIFDLECWNIGLKEYIYRLEECIIQFIALYGIKGERMEKATGVWIDTKQNPRKICAIGVKSSRYITMHGFALNINTDLSYFNTINPCGFTDKGVTSLEQECKRNIDMEEAKKKLSDIFQTIFP